MTDSVKITTSNTHSNMDSGDLLLASNINLKLIPKNNQCDCNLNMSNSVENTQTNTELNLRNKRHIPYDCWRMIKEYMGIGMKYKPRYFKNIPTSINWVFKETLGYNGDFEYNQNNPPTVTHNYNLSIIKRTPKLLKTEINRKKNLLKIKKEKNSEYVDFKCFNQCFTILPNLIVMGRGGTIIQDGVERNGKILKKRIIKKRIIKKS